jgi:hypothetical protein
LKGFRKKNQIYRDKLIKKLIAKKYNNKLDFYKVKMEKLVIDSEDDPISRGDASIIIVASKSIKLPMDDD